MEIVAVVQKHMQKDKEQEDERASGHTQKHRPLVQNVSHLQSVDSPLK